MKILFQNPGLDYSIDSILHFQATNASPFWSDSLLFFYPQLDKGELMRRNTEGMRQYLTDILSDIYNSLAAESERKLMAYEHYFTAHQTQIEDALSDAFGVDSRVLFNDLTANITLNPVCPRFLTEHRFDVFHKNSERGALGISLHEVIHFFWFHVWNQHFGDRYDDYESPSLKWILSEMVVESIMSDPRLSTINPYFPRENGGCVYPYFQNMVVDGTHVLDTLAHMYRSNHITDFMELAYRYCQQHENTIRTHIIKSEEAF